MTVAPAARALASRAAAAGRVATHEEFGAQTTDVRSSSRYAVVAGLTVTATGRGTLAECEMTAGVALGAGPDAARAAEPETVAQAVTKAAPAIRSRRRAERESGKEAII